MSLFAKTPDGRLVNLDTGLAIDGGLTTAGTLTITPPSGTAVTQAYTRDADLAAAMAQLETITDAKLINVTPPTQTNAAPTITGVTPNTAVGANGTTVEITGTNFAMGMTASIGGVALINGGPVSGVDSLWTLAPGALAAGVYDVVVTNPDGQKATDSAAFTVT